MLIQALPLLTLNPLAVGCTMAVGASTAVTYSIGGPHMTQTINGVVQHSAVVGVVLPGSCVTEVIQASGPYTVSFSISGVAGSAQTLTVSATSMILTYSFVRNARALVFVNSAG
jgi:hypothetical protein